MSECILRKDFENFNYSIQRTSIAEEIQQENYQMEDEGLGQYTVEEDDTLMLISFKIYEENNTMRVFLYDLGQANLADKRKRFFFE